eukprot:Hpha_TRINITY_DN15070_c0_g1::TRINITY_DN15070_c0_g1_i1::g.124896::m.124896/K04952/CNGB1; cyclic nucleotide gated channel beta 1
MGCDEDSIAQPLIDLLCRQTLPPGVQHSELRDWVETKGLALLVAWVDSYEPPATSTPVSSPARPPSAPTSEDGVRLQLPEQTPWEAAVQASLPETGTSVVPAGLPNFTSALRTVGQPLVTTTSSQQASSRDHTSFINQSKVSKNHLPDFAINSQGTNPSSDPKSTNKSSKIIGASSNLLVATSLMGRSPSLKTPLNMNGVNGSPVSAFDRLISWQAQKTATGTDGSGEETSPLAEVATNKAAKDDYTRVSMDTAGGLDDSSIFTRDDDLTDEQRQKIQHRQRTERLAGLIAKRPCSIEEDEYSSWFLRFGLVWVVLIFLTANLFLLPYRGCFLVEGAEWFWGELVMDLAAVLFVFNYKFLAPQMQDNGSWLSQRRLLFRRYTRSCTFWVDVVSLFPYQLFGLIGGIELAQNPIWRFPRLLQIVYLTSYSAKALARAEVKAPLAARIVKFGATGLLWLHLVTCATFRLAVDEEATSEEWFSFPGFFEADSWHQYALVMDFALRQLTGHNGVLPVTDMQVGVSTFTAVTGLALLSVLLSVGTSAVINHEQTAGKLPDKLDAARDCLSHMRLPQSYLDEVQGYYRSMWLHCKAFSTEEQDGIINDLPEILAISIRVELNAVIVGKIPLFHKLKDDRRFLLDIVSALQFFVALPGQVLVHKGDVGDEMFFLHRGEIAIIDDNEVTIAVLYDGAHFGELSLLFNQTRQATARAEQFSQLYLLTKGDFDSAVDFYPEALLEILDGAAQLFTQQPRRLTAKTDGLIDFGAGVGEVGSATGSDWNVDLNGSMFNYSASRSTAAATPRDTPLSPSPEVSFSRSGNPLDADAKRKRQTPEAVMARMGIAVPSKRVSPPGVGGLPTPLGESMEAGGFDAKLPESAASPPLPPVRRESNVSSAASCFGIGGGSVSIEALQSAYFEERQRRGTLQSMPKTARMSITVRSSGRTPIITGAALSGAVESTGDSGGGLGATGRSRRPPPRPRGSKMRKAEEGDDIYELAKQDTLLAAADSSTGDAIMES